MSMSLEIREKVSARAVADYQRRKTWSRTDSARWLNERSEAVLAQLRRRGLEAPAYSKQMGFWLKEVAASRAIFDRAHERLLEIGNDKDRARAVVLEVVR